MSLMLGAHQVTQLPNGTYKVQVGDVERIGTLGTLYETIANFNVNVAIEKGFCLNKPVPKSEAQVRQAKKDKQTKHAAEGKEKQRQKMAESPFCSDHSHDGK
jgi:hypothetical protein